MMTDCVSDRNERPKKHLYRVVLSRQLTPYLQHQFRHIEGFGEDIIRGTGNKPGIFEIVDAGNKDHMGIQF